MIGILPGRLATRQRLFTGAILVAGISLLNLIPLEFGPFGSPWPIALLWAACGWAGLGPNLTAAGLLFILGLWIDALSGTPLGLWSSVALLTTAVTIGLSQYLGLGSLGRLGNAGVSGIAMLVIMVIANLWRGAHFYLLGAVLPIVTAIIAYQFVGRLFELSEDET